MQNSPTRSAIDVGSVLDDTYTIEALIGRGGMGAVFLASHRRLAGKKVAIKMLLADVGGDEILARFKREADITSTLDHPNIVKVENYNVLPDGTPYIAYEFLQGESLAQRLREGPVPAEQLFSIIRGVGSALGAAHRAGIVHRDLKPQNIFLVQSEVAGHAIELAKVLDFGISKLRGSQTMQTQDSALLGTPQYMAPEQAIGQHSAVDERTDIFALGAIVYEMVTGRPAFNGASIPEVVFKVVYEQPAPLPATVPAPIAAAIATAMAKTAADRFPTVAAFVEALTGQPLALPPRSAPARPVSSGEPKKITANEAFAQTMGSGDHGASPMVGPTVSATPAPAAALAPRVAPANVVTNAPTEADRKRSPWLVPVLALAGVGLAAAGVYVATRAPAREPDRDARRGREERIAEVEQAPPTPHVPSVQPADAAVAVAAPDAAAPPVRPIPTTKPPVSASKAADDDTAGDFDTAKQLAEAEVALRDKHLERTEQLANVIINSESAGKGQRAHAHVLRGIAQCAVHHSEEGAAIDLRQLVGFSALRHRLLAACHAEGYLATETD